MTYSTTISDINRAALRVSDLVVHTPLLESSFINEKLGGRVLFKPECLQKTGSFKFRGGLNTIRSLDDAQKAKGVVAFSSGNHAQGVAYAAQLENVPAVIIMPEDAPAIKIENTKKYGAEVVLYDRYTEDRDEIGDKISKERGLYLIKPYDAVLTIAGQGTAGLEIARDCMMRDIQPDQLISPCGGGGLMAGLSIAMNEHFKRTKLYAAEPAEFNDTVRSLASGNYETNALNARSICDALLSPSPGKLTFPINKDLLASAFSVTDDEVKHAVRVAFRELKLVVEPGGAVGLATLLAGKLDCSNKTTIVFLSGGNIDNGLFQSILSDG